MASRFFAGGSSTESESESSDEGIQVPQKQVPVTRFFLSDDEEETKRVVRSAKSKRHDEVTDIIKQIRNQKKIRDVSRVQTSFEELMRVYTKSQNVLQTDDGQCPRYYIRCVVEMEEFVNEIWEDKKKLNKSNAKSLSTLRQKTRKYMKELDTQITKYRENPDAADKEDEEPEERKSDDESDSDDDDEPISTPSFKKVPLPKVKPEGDYDDDSDDSWDVSMSSDSSSDDEVPGMTTLTAEYFLKKTSTADDKLSKKKERRKERVRPKEEEGLEEEEGDEDGDGKWEKVKGGIKMEKEKPKMFAKDVEITHSVVTKKLSEIVGARGKRSTNRADQIELLKELRNIANQHNLGLGIDLKIAFHVMSAVFDYNPNVATCMKPAIWEMCLALMAEMLDILVANPDIVVSENMTEDNENLEEAPFKIRGCILTVAERLDEEFTKMLQATDAHSTDYVERLKDETIVTTLIVRLQAHLENTSTSSEICRIYLRHIQHIYYKYDYEKLRELEKSRAAAKTERESKEEKRDDGQGEKTDDGQGEKTDDGQGEKTDDGQGEKTDDGQGEKKEEETKDKSEETKDKTEETKDKTEETADKTEEMSDKTEETADKTEETADKTKETTEKSEENKPTEEAKLEGEEKEKKQDEESSLDLMNRMCKYIYSKDTTDLIRTRTMLCHIYHYAIHDRWYTARDLMLMSHLQQTIQFSDIPTQILYNRTMVQLGLCAFRHGNVRDAHNALLDIQSGGRAKELLAQGLLMRQQERDAQQEKIEKSRQLPFHMHINLELLECVYLVSAMLLEIPYMASHHFDIRRRMISKSFHHQLRLSERQTLIGPPESMREHVVAASRAMRYGDWRGCKKFLINEKMNMKVWNLFQDSNHVRDLITKKIQEESLRTYLFTYGSVYDSLSLITLSDMFELEKTAVHSIVSKMIINEELMASWDEPAATIVIHRCEPTRLQHLSLRLADKVSNLVENNERLIDSRMGDNRFKDRGFNKDGSRREGGYKDGGRRDGGYQGRGYQGNNRYRGGGGGGGRGGRYNRDGQGRDNYQRGGYNRDGGGQRGGYNRDGGGQRGGYNRDGGGQRGGYNRGGGGRGQYNRDGQGRDSYRGRGRNY